jgi:hypothetical protein
MSNTTTAVTPQASALEFPAASPLCSLKQRVGLTDVQVSYSRPGMKGRHVFGALVPYGKLWRAGANQATKISFSTAVKLNGTDIAAGAYALFAIPSKDEWTLIINKDAEQAGTGKYDEKLDAARIKVKPEELQHTVENYTIEIDPIDDETASLNLLWERTKVSLKLEVDFVEKLIPQVEAAMASDEQKKPYVQAALFFLNHSKDLKKADEWIDAAIVERPVYPFFFIKAQILAKLGNKKEALSAAKKAGELATEADDLGFVSRTEKFLSGLN